MHQAELLVEYVRFLAAVADENNSVHDNIKLHIPYHMAMLPFWHIGSAKENNHGIPRGSLQAFIGFVRAVYFPELDADAIMGKCSVGTRACCHFISILDRCSRHS